MSKKIQWTQLEHSGPLFPEEYTPLPKGIHMFYDGKPVVLNSTDRNNLFNMSAEEAAYLYCEVYEREARLSSASSKRESVMDYVFNNNFWNDWFQLTSVHHPEILYFDKVDFSLLVRYISEVKIDKAETRGMMLPEEKKFQKAEKQQIKDDFGYATIDGQLMAIGNFKVQPPGLMIGHKSKQRGQIKKRIQPSDIIVNGSKVEGSEWGGKMCDSSVSYLAKYKNNVSKQFVYIHLDRKVSRVVEENDKMKFDKAKTLGENISLIRQAYSVDIMSPYLQRQQLGVALFLLDNIALRPGTEKDELTENDTVGLTTLRIENINLLPENKIQFKFFGKSSIEFNKTFKFDSNVYARLYSFIVNKSERDQIFDLVNANNLNAYIKSIVPGCTAKTFRTWKASSVLQKQLFENKVSVDDNLNNKSIAFKTANIKTALALNHKKLNQDNEKALLTIQEAMKKEQAILMDVSSSVAKKQKAHERLGQLALSKREKEQNVSIITSKVNYIDPRIVVAWAKRVEYPIEKIYNASHLQKFRWAVETMSTWTF